MPKVVCKNICNYFLWNTRFRHVQNIWRYYETGPRWCFKVIPIIMLSRLCPSDVPKHCVGLGYIKCIEIDSSGNGRCGEQARKTQLACTSRKCLQTRELIYDGFPMSLSVSYSFSLNRLPRFLGNKCHFEGSNKEMSMSIAPPQSVHHWDLWQSQQQAKYQKINYFTIFHGSKHPDIIYFIEKKLSKNCFLQYQEKRVYSDGWSSWLYIGWE